MRRRDAGITLVEATALYRTGASAEADAVAARVEGGGDSEASARATFLRGLIADERGNEQGGAEDSHGMHPYFKVVSRISKATAFAWRLGDR